MKKFYLFAAAAAACFSLIAVTGCEKTPENEEEETVTLSIENQWVTTFTDSYGSSAKRCFDIGIGTPDKILIGDWADGYDILLESMGITGIDPDKSFFSMTSGAQEIVSITPSADGTSGTVVYNVENMYDPTAEPTQATIKYSKLTETSVELTVEEADPMNPSEIIETTYSCTAAAEPVKIYSYADITM